MYFENTITYFPRYFLSNKLRTRRTCLVECQVIKTWQFSDFAFFALLFNSVKKQGLTWKSRMLLFQNSSWKSDKKRVSIFAKSAAEKISSTVCQGLWKEQK
jgi:hypothetical protein